MTYCNFWVFIGLQVMCGEPPPPPPHTHTHTQNTSHDTHTHTHTHTKVITNSEGGGSQGPKP